MTVITVGQQKGGTGKSTGAVNLAAVIKSLGYSVIIVDSDKQRSAATWAEYREEANVKPKIPCVEKLGNVRETLVELNNQYEYVIVDAAGRDSRELRTALSASHVFLCPFEASQFSLETISKVNEFIEDALDLNPNLLSLSYLSKVPTNALNTEAADAVEVIKSCGNFEHLKAKIHDRKAYRSCIPEGISVIESKNPKAKKEICQLAWEMVSHIEARFA